MGKFSKNRCIVRKMKRLLRNFFEQTDYYIYRVVEIGCPLSRELLKNEWATIFKFLFVHRLGICQKNYTTQS